MKLTSSLLPALAAGVGLAFAASSTAFARPDYVAHEWGTFTSIQGSDGKTIGWHPAIGSDLPPFVHTRTKPVDAPAGSPLTAFGLLSGKESSHWLQRMETPVIYFHAKQPLTVDLRVEFPKGLVTEWYPAASSFGPAFGVENVLAESGESHATWKGLEILPKGDAPDPRLPAAAKASHYFAARDAFANPIRTSHGFGKTTYGIGEVENHLFYRGVGNFDAPLRVTNPGSDIVLENLGKEPLTDLFIWDAHGDTALLAPVKAIAAGGSASLQSNTGVIKGSRRNLTLEFNRRLKYALTAAGLNQDEAAAMLHTWADSWFDEDGTRVLYIVPRSFTDRILPLKFSPAPSRLERVFVGRAEILTGEVETQAAQLAEAHFADPKAGAAAKLRSLTVPRFHDALVSRIRDMHIATRKLTLSLTCSGSDFAEKFTKESRTIETQYAGLRSAR